MKETWVPMENDHYFKKGPLKGAGREPTKKSLRSHAKAFNLYFRSTKNMGASGCLENGPFSFWLETDPSSVFFEHVKLFIIGDFFEI